MDHICCRVEVVAAHVALNPHVAHLFSLADVCGNETQKWKSECFGQIDKLILKRKRFFYHERRLKRTMEVMECCPRLPSFSCLGSGLYRSIRHIHWVMTRQARLAALLTHLSTEEKCEGSNVGWLWQWELCFLKHLGLKLNFRSIGYHNIFLKFKLKHSNHPNTPTKPTHTTPPQPNPSQPPTRLYLATHRRSAQAESPKPPWMPWSARRVPKRYRPSPETPRNWKVWSFSPKWRSKKENSSFVGRSLPVWQTSKRDKPINHS